MRRLLLFMAWIGACTDGGPALIPVENAMIQRSYVLTACQVQANPPSAPPDCVIYLSGTSRTALDSARIVLRADHSVWGMASGVNRQTCFVCPPPGYTTSVLFDTASGTWQLTRDSLIITYRGSGVAHWTNRVVYRTNRLPPRVPEGWNGPDSLLLPSGVIGVRDGWVQLFQPSGP